MSFVGGTDDEGSFTYGSGGDFQVGTYDESGNDVFHIWNGIEEDDSRPKVLLMGLRKSGKSSIQKVVFHKMSPNETLFLESTNKIIKEDISNSRFVKFATWDTPGQLDYFDPSFDADAMFGSCSSLAFVVDAQDDYMEAVSKLVLTVGKAYSINPEINFEVFIHKVDSLSDETKMETQRDINARVVNEMSQEMSGITVPLRFYLTSIYDHSIFEAFSRVVQKLIPQLPKLEHLMNSFIAYTDMEKAFLFDVVSKIYIATDSSPVDMQSYELCCDMIDVVIDVSSIYGPHEDVENASFDSRSSSFIRLNNSTILFLREVDKVLALVCIMRDESFFSKGNSNVYVHQFREAIRTALSSIDEKQVQDDQEPPIEEGSPEVPAE